MVGIAGAETHKTNRTSFKCYVCGNVIGGISEYGKKQTNCSYSAMGIHGIGLVQFCSKECHDKIQDNSSGEN